MPLSEHEQRLLEQMERALYAEDPKFASTLRGKDLRGRYRRRALLGIVGLAAGLALLVTGVASNLVPVSVAGFVVMIASAWWVVSSWRRIPGPGDLGLATPPSTGGKPAKGRKPSRPGVMNRFEERWRRRTDDDGR